MRTTHIRAFSLMEMTLVLLVLSIVSASGLTLWQDRDTRSKTAKTNRRMDAIEKALQDFRYAHHRLPCPADAGLKLHDGGFGAEGQVAGQCDNGTPQVIVTAEGIAIGTIPTRALGLPDDYMYDAWGRRFTYHVAASLTEMGAMLTLPAPDECPAAIRIDDANGVPRTEKAVYALISHGTNGHGAYLSSGQRRNAQSLSAAESANAGVDASFAADYGQPLVMRRRVESDTASERFDDILRYKERWGLVSAADIWLTKTEGPYFIKITANSSRSTDARAFTCAIDNAFLPWCWGYNTSGQLGYGNTTATNVPTPVLLPEGVRGFIDISAGGSHTCGISLDRKAYCWGSSSSGKTGGISQHSPELPLPFPAGVTAYRAIYAGDNGTCAIDQLGRGWCWGQNKGNASGSSDPAIITEVAGGHSWKHFSLAEQHSCGITSTDETFCWGDNSDYQLGDGTTNARSVPTTPVPMPAGESHYIRIIAGSDNDPSISSYTCGLAASGTGYCWGYKKSNFGDSGSYSGSYPSPVPIAFRSGVSAYTALDVAGRAGCALDTQGQAYCWGRYLGDGTSSQSNLPKKVLMPPDVSFTEIVHGKQVICALGNDLRAYCWGRGHGYYHAGPVGDGTWDDTLAPSKAHYPPECS